MGECRDSFSAAVLLAGCAVHCGRFIEQYQSVLMKGPWGLCFLEGFFLIWEGKGGLSSKAWCSLGLHSSLGRQTSFFFFFLRNLELKKGALCGHQRPRINPRGEMSSEKRRASPWVPRRSPWDRAPEKASTGWGVPKLPFSFTGLCFVFFFSVPCSTAHSEHGPSFRELGEKSLAGKKYKPLDERSL